MIDIKLLRTDLDNCKSALQTRGVDPGDLDEIMDLDLKVRNLMTSTESIRAEIKALSKQYSQTKSIADPMSETPLIMESKKFALELEQQQKELNTLKDELNLKLLYLPNIPSKDTPVGKDSSENPVVKIVNGDMQYADYQCVPHWDIGAELSILDMKNGAKISGSMFPIYRKAGAKLIRALTNFALDMHSDVFEEIRPPTFVKSDTMRSTGHLPKFSDEAYHMERDDLWAIPTAEVPLTSLGKDEIFIEDELPKYLTAVTACFRREAGAAGSDTRGLLRVHEFDKVEILAYTTEDTSQAAHKLLLERAEKLVELLGLKYRILDLCTGDLGNSSKRTFDIEAYAPGCDKWLEVSSVSWFGDYQARRANIRYRKKDDQKPVYINTLNGSALAWPRIWAAVVETGRNADGTVTLPKVLSRYLNDRLTISLTGELV